LKDNDGSAKSCDTQKGHGEIFKTFWG